MTARAAWVREAPLWSKESYSSTRDIRVHFATNRNHEGPVLATEMSYGEVQITVPETHPVGSIAENYSRGPTRSLNLEELKAQLARDQDWGALVFIHGFNVDFNEALLRAAQIAYDLKFQGTVLLVSWPAGKNGGFFEKNLINRTYEMNQRNARESIDSFATFFKELTRIPIPFQFLIHSMGHQIALPALGKVAPELETPFMQELILNAPDFDPAEFEALLGNLKKISRRITLYCSQKDNAMLASKAFNGRKRLGACSRHEGVDVINVSEVDEPGLTGLGHGYYASRPVLTDMAQALLGIDAERRLFIRKPANPANEHYYLRR